MALIEFSPHFHFQLEMSGTHCCPDNTGQRIIYNKSQDQLEVCSKRRWWCCWESQKAEVQENRETWDKIDRVFREQGIDLTRFKIDVAKKKDKGRPLTYRHLQVVKTAIDRGDVTVKPVRVSSRSTVQGLFEDKGKEKVFTTENSIVE